MAFQVGRDAAQHFGQIGPGAAAGIEDIDVLRCQPLGDVEIVPKRLVHAGDHVADNFRRRVPDTELLAQFGIKGFQERLVEIRDRLAFVETREKRLSFDAVKRGGRPVEDLHEAERLQSSRLRQLLAQGGKDGRSQVPYGGAPVEPAGCRFAVEQRSCIGSLATRPQHPRGEHPVEQRLHKGGMKEARAALALEAHAERFFQRSAHRRKRLSVARRLDPRQPVARIGGKQPRQVLRLRQGRPVRQRAGEILSEAGTDRPGKCPGPFQLRQEVVCAVGSPKGLQLRGAARRVLAHQHEVAHVGHEHEPVASPVAADLIARCRQPGIVIHGLHLDDAALRHLALSWLAPLHLVRRIQAEVGMARALVGKLTDAEHLRLERRASSAQQSVKRTVAGTLAGRPA